MEPKPYNEAEYNSLRDELIKRIEIRQNIVSLVFVSASTLLGFSIKSTELAFLYPPLSLLLCVMWAQNDMRALQITDYLQTLENEDTKLGWTTFYKQAQGQGSFFSGLPFSVIAPGGTFILTSLMAFGIGCSRWPSSGLYLTLLIADIISIMLMVWMLLYIRKNRLSRRSSEKVEANYLRSRQ